MNQDDNQDTLLLNKIESIILQLLSNADNSDNNDGSNSSTCTSIPYCSYKYTQCEWMAKLLFLRIEEDDDDVDFQRIHDDECYRKWKEILESLHNVLHPIMIPHLLTIFPSLSHLQSNTSSISQLHDDEDNHPVLQFTPHLLFQSITHLSSYSSLKIQYYSPSIKCLLILLASMAISHSSYSHSTTTTIRYKRLYSLCMEHIAFFQQLYFVSQQNNTTSSSSGKTNSVSLFIDACTLFTGFVIPSIQSVLKLLEQGYHSTLSSSSTTTTNNKRPTMAMIHFIKASMIQTCTSLAYHLIQSHQSNNHLDKHYCYDSTRKECMLHLISYINILAPNERIDEVWIHPIRHFFYHHSSSSSFFIGENDDKDTASKKDENITEYEMESIISHHKYQHILNQVDPLICRTYHDEGGMQQYLQDKLCGVDMCWNVEGLALLAYELYMYSTNYTRCCNPNVSSSLQSKSHGDIVKNPSSLEMKSVILPKDQKYNLGIPLTYSHEMLFVIFYPHAIKLIEMSQNDDETTTTTDGIYQNRTRRTYLQMGLEMLHQILLHVSNISTMTTINSPNKSTDDSKEYKYYKDWSCGILNTKQINHFLHPLYPVPLIQLLLNELVNTSTIQQQQQQQQEQKADSNSHYYPSKQFVINLIRQNLLLYDPKLQIKCIGTLIRHCPNPSLIPVLIDFIRIIIPLVQHYNVMDSGHEDNKACIIDDILKILTPYMEHVRSSINTPNEGEEEDDSQPTYTLSNPHDLNIEIIVCISSLFKLILLQTSLAKYIKTKILFLEFIDIVGVQLLSAVKCHIEERIQNGDPENDFFHFYLLDDAIEELMKYFSMK